MKDNGHGDAGRPNALHSDRGEGGGRSDRRQRVRLSDPGTRCSQGLPAGKCLCWLVVTVTSGPGPPAAWRPAPSSAGRAPAGDRPAPSSGLEGRRTGGGGVTSA